VYKQERRRRRGVRKGEGKSYTGVKRHETEYRQERGEEEKNVRFVSA
jgi:hypothetical protein